MLALSDNHFAEKRGKAQPETGDLSEVLRITFKGNEKFQVAQSKAVSAQSLTYVVEHVADRLTSLNISGNLLVGISPVLNKLAVSSCVLTRALSDDVKCSLEYHQQLLLFLYRNGARLWKCLKSTTALFPMTVLC